MTESLSSILTIAGIALLVTILWGVTIAFVYWDASRNTTRGGKQIIWMALAVLLPLVGFVAYLVNRLLTRTQAHREGTLPFTVHRATALKRPPGAPVHLPTIAGQDFLRPTSPAARPAQAPPQLRQAIPASYTVEIVKGPHTGNRIHVEQLPVRIGRGSSAAIRLNDDLGVSRHHAEIYERGGALYLRDLQSTHGTYLNDQRILDTILEPGDEIRIGVSVLILKPHREIP